MNNSFDSYFELIIPFLFSNQTLLYYIFEHLFGPSPFLDIMYLN